MKKFIYKIPGLAAVYHFFLAFLGSVIFGNPSKKIFVVGVTGTKGKTTTLEILNAILETAGKKTALLSSLRVKIGEESAKNKTGNTMPGRFYIQRFLRRAVAAKCKYALVEVTSQGVALSRHRFIDWNSAIITNIAPEHIEYHKSFENYRAVKSDFLKYVLSKRGKVFVNRNDEASSFFLESLKGERVIAYSSDDKRISDIMPYLRPGDAAGESTKEFSFADFNKDNITAAASFALSLGINGGIIEEALRNFRTVRGRMEFVRKGHLTAVVDYAHTPDSLKKVYSFLRGLISKSQFPEARLVCVLGAAGGGRDKWKRPVMGEIASQYCDEIILTDEDPYDEDPLEIISEIKKGIFSSGRFPAAGVSEILDRREAINRAVGFLKDGDVFVATGKGSEDFIHVARGKKVPWSDKEIIEEAMKSKYGR